MNFKKGLISLTLLFTFSSSSMAFNDYDRAMAISSLNSSNLAVKIYDQDKNKLMDVCIDGYADVREDSEAIHYSGFDFTCDKYAHYFLVYPDVLNHK